MNGIIGQEFNNGQNFPKMAKLLREQSTASKTHIYALIQIYYLYIFTYIIYVFILTINFIYLIFDNALNLIKITYYIENTLQIHCKYIELNVLKDYKKYIEFSFLKTDTQKYIENTLKKYIEFSFLKTDTQKYIENTLKIHDFKCPKRL